MNQTGTSGMLSPFLMDGSMNPMMMAAPQHSMMMGGMHPMMMMGGFMHPMMNPLAMSRNQTPGMAAAEHDDYGGRPTQPTIVEVTEQKKPQTLPLAPVRSRSEETPLHRSYSTLGGDEKACGALKGIPMLDRKMALEKCCRKLAVAKTYAWSQRTVDMAIWVGCNIEPNRRCLAMGFKTKGDYRQCIVDEYQDNNKVFDIMTSVSETEVRKMATEAKWDSSWNELYPSDDLGSDIVIPKSKKARVGGTVHDDEAVDAELDYFERLEKLQTLREKFGVAPGPVVDKVAAEEEAVDLDSDLRLEALFEQDIIADAVKLAQTAAEAAMKD